ncbi:MAG: S8 family serine peptidase [Candidatus Deferrimicrobiaceae bacterium]
MNGQRQAMHSRWARFAAGAILVLCGLFSLSGTTVEPDLRTVDPRLLQSAAMATGVAREQTSGAAPAEGIAIPMFLRVDEDDPALPGKILLIGGSATRVASRIYVAKVPRDAVRYVSNWANVSYLDGAKPVRRMLDVSRPAVSANTVQAGTPGFPPPFDSSGLKGDNVYIGFVDTGLYGSHPDFLTGGTGSPSRIVHTYSSSADPLVDEDGHGTHVAGIAAGNGFSSGGTYTGMAPGAALMIGKSTFTTTDIVAVLQNLVDFAESRTPPRPVAINLSVGLVMGPNDGTSGFESAINALAAGASGSRRLVAAAAGNEHDQGEHFRTVVGEPFGTRTISLRLHSTLSPAIFPQVDIWAYGATKDPDPGKRTEYDEYTVSVTFSGDSVTVPSGRSLTSPGGRITVSNRVDTNVPNGATHITLSLDPALAGLVGTVRFDRTRNGGTGVIDGYVDHADGIFPAPEPAGSITEPGNGANVVTVGSFRTKAIGGSAVPQAISSFSSIGPTRDGRLKPDIAAPGEYLSSTRSLIAPITNYSGIVDNNYAIDRGTSMATPHVTGVAALVWQSNPSLTGSGMRERLRRTANPPTDGSATPNTTWGYGKLSALRAVQETVAAISAPARATPGTPASLTSENSSAGFGAAISGYLWSAPGADLASTGQPDTTFTANAPGNYTVSLTATAGGSSGSDSRNILVNTVPTATFTVPASDNAGRSVSFPGTASDADGQSLTRHWILVSRPAGSAASITAANVDNAVFTPDVAGTYDIGLRADDGLDNSALVVHPYATLDSPAAPPSSGGGGGGGCQSVTRAPAEKIDASSVVSLSFLFLPAAVYAWRRRVRSGKPGFTR